MADGNDGEHAHHRGLAFDLPTLMNRRRALQLLGGAGLGAGLLAVAGCGSSSSGASTAASSGATTATTASGASSASTAMATLDVASCAVLPTETAGPYPGDGSNGPDVLSESGVVRSDITTSFGSSSGTAAGVPLTVKLKVLDTASGCTPLAGAAVYIWHCDQEGRYSMYSQGVTDQNYLRGVQAADADGWVTFQSIFPACYSGRWPHIHFEIYPSTEAATSVSGRLLTSQLALPQDVCDVVYATDGYSASVRNLSQTSLQRDNVFSDGWTTQLATVTGDTSAGYVAQLNVPV